MATPTITPTTARGLVLVTGGAGYIAGYCIAQLLSDGWRVRTTVRKLGRGEEVRATIGKIAPNAGEVEFVAADLNADAGWADAVTRADYVLHVASPVPTVDPKSDDELVRPARDGTLRVLKAARDASVKRAVMTSSISVIADSSWLCGSGLQQNDDLWRTPGQLVSELVSDNSADDGEQCDEDRDVARALPVPVHCRNGLRISCPGTLARRPALRPAPWSPCTTRIATGFPKPGSGAAAGSSLGQFKNLVPHWRAISMS